MILVMDIYLWGEAEKLNDLLMNLNNGIILKKAKKVKLDYIST